jgi:hypothetical protein
MDGLKPTHPPGMSTFRAKATASLRGGRRAPRLPVDLEGALTGRVVHPVRLVDLSLTGCLVRCEALLEPGAILDLRLHLGEAPLTAKVRVVDSSLDGDVAEGRSPGAMAGLDFVSVAAQDQTRLRRFLEDERRRRRSADAPPD